MNAMIQTYDIVMLVVLLGAAILGAWKGMVWQIASLASIAVSGGVAVHFSAPLAPYFNKSEPWNRFLAMFVLYILSSLAIWLAFRMVSGLIDRVKLKEFDRQMGALFGLAKGVLLCVVITFFAVTLSEQARQAVLKSHSGDAIARLTRHAGPLLPEDVRAVVGKYIDELDHKLDPNTPPTQTEEKIVGQIDLHDPLHSAEQKLQDATSQRMEELGRQANQKLDELSRQSHEALDSKNLQQSRGGR
jgi:membrane protein required for colicin V production